MDVEEQAMVCNNMFVKNKDFSGAIRWVVGIVIVLFLSSISWAFVIQSDVSGNKKSICAIEKQQDRLEVKIEKTYETLIENQKTIIRKLNDDN